MPGRSGNFAGKWPPPHAVRGGKRSSPVGNPENLEDLENSQGMAVRPQNCPWKNDGSLLGITATRASPECICHAGLSRVHLPSWRGPSARGTISPGIHGMLSWANRCSPGHVQECSFGRFLLFPTSFLLLSMLFFYRFLPTFLAGVLPGVSFTS